MKTELMRAWALILAVVLAIAVLSTESAIVVFSLGTVAGPLLYYAVTPGEVDR